MTNKNIRRNTSVSVCEDNGRTKVHPKHSQFWLLYSNLSSGRQQYCHFTLSAQVSDLLNALWKVWTGFILQLGVQGFLCCQHRDTHLYMHGEGHLSCPHLSNIHFYTCLFLLSLSQLQRQLRQRTFLMIQNKINLFLLC